MSSPRTQPDHDNKGWPSGIPFIVGNEAAERFSYYGMATILFFYLEYLFQQSGASAKEATDGATTLQHMFFAGVYATPILGAVLADRLLGKYKTILYLSLFYCLGHALMSIGEDSLGMSAAGLICIAIGAGGIKPCVGAHLGDQFGKSNWPRLARIYQIFYLSINLGAFASTLLIPWVRDTWGYSVAFLIPGILMGVATLLFWLGRHRFVHIPASPGGKLGALDVLSGWLIFLAPVSLLFFGQMSWYESINTLGKVLISLGLFASGVLVFSLRQSLKADTGFLAVLFYSLRSVFSNDEKPALAGVTPGSFDGFWGPASRRFGDDKVRGPKAVLAIASLFSVISVFWALFDQTHTTWTAQAKYMHRAYEVFGWQFTIAPDQFQAANPLMILGLVPLLSLVIFPFVRRATGWEIRPLTQMRVGMFLTVTSFVAIALIQQQIDSGAEVDIWWQLVGYLLITTAEVMVSITGLEFAYSQAPSSMKSVLMGLWYLSVSIGNLLVAGITGLDSVIAGWWNAAPLNGEEATLSDAQRFWLYAGLMFVAATIFLIMSRLYKYRDYAPDGTEIVS